MSGRIHFVSGKTLDIEEIEFKNISPKLGAKELDAKYLKLVILFH